MRIAFSPMSLHALMLQSFALSADPVQHQSLDAGNMRMGPLMSRQYSHLKGAASELEQLMRQRAERLNHERALQMEIAAIEEAIAMQEDQKAKLHARKEVNLAYATRGQPAPHDSTSQASHCMNACRSSCSLTRALDMYAPHSARRVKSNMMQKQVGMRVGQRLALTALICWRHMHLLATHLHDSQVHA